MSAVEAVAAATAPTTSRVPQRLFTWEEIFVRAPQMAATMARHLDQLRVSARPATLGAYDDALRMFAGHITTVDPACRSVAAIEHRHVEAHKTWMASRPGRSGGKLSATTISHRLCLLRTFFEREAPPSGSRGRVGGGGTRHRLSGGVVGDARGKSGRPGR